MIDRLETPVARWVNVDRECTAELPRLLDAIEAWAAELDWPDLGRIRRAGDTARPAISNYIHKLRSIETTDRFHIGDENARKLVRLAGIDMSFEDMHAMAADFLDRTFATLEESRCHLVEKHGLARDYEVVVTMDADLPATRQ